MHSATSKVRGVLVASASVAALAAGRVIGDGVPRARGVLGAPRADASALAMITDVQKAFAEFKETHAKQAKDGDTLLNSKLDAINTYMTEKQSEIDALNQKMAALASNAGDGRKVKDAEYTEAFMAHIKKGDINASLNKGTDAEGGYLAPTEWDRSITNKLKLASQMRNLARVQGVGGTTFSKLYSKGETASGWVGETAERPETATGTFGSLDFPTGELYANPAATQRMLDDAQIDLEAWLAEEVQTEFAKQEGAAFINGDGANKPHGLLTYVTGAANAARHPFGAIGLINSGAAAALTSDGLVKLIYELPSIFLGNASFIMNRNTQGLVRLLKDGQGNYLWQPSYVAGQPATLAGYPLAEMPDMPNVAAGAKAIAFGDFNQGYLIIDRQVVRVLRDPYSKKPYVMFYTTKRVGGGVSNPEAIRVQNVAV